MFLSRNNTKIINFLNNNNPKIYPDNNCDINLDPFSLIDRMNNNIISDESDIDKICNIILNNFLKLIDFFDIFENKKLMEEKINSSFERLNYHLVSRLGNDIPITFFYSNFPLINLPYKSGLKLISLKKINIDQEIDLFINSDISALNSSSKSFDNILYFYGDVSNLLFSSIIGSDWNKNVYIRNSLSISNNLLLNKNNFINSNKAKIMMNLILAFKTKLIEDELFGRFSYIWDDENSNKIVHDINLIKKLNMSMKSFIFPLDYKLIRNIRKSNTQFNSDLTMNNDDNIVFSTKSIINSGDELLLRNKNINNDILLIENLSHDDYSLLLVNLIICWNSKSIREKYIDNLITFTLDILLKYYNKICDNTYSLENKRLWCDLISDFNKFCNGSNNDKIIRLVKRFLWKNEVNDTFEYFLDMMNLSDKSFYYTYPAYALNSDLGVYFGNYDEQDPKIECFLHGKIRYDPFSNNYTEQFIDENGKFSEGYGHKTCYYEGISSKHVKFSYVMNYYSDKQNLELISNNSSSYLFFNQESSQGKLYTGVGYNGNYYEAFFHIPVRSSSSMIPKFRRYYKESNQSIMEMFNNVKSTFDNLKNEKKNITNRRKKINVNNSNDHLSVLKKSSINKKIINRLPKNFRILNDYSKLLYNEKNFDIPNINFRKNWKLVKDRRGRCYYYNQKQNLTLKSTFDPSDSCNGWAILKNPREHIKDFTEINLYSKFYHRRFIKDWNILDHCFYLNVNLKGYREVPFAYRCKYGCHCKYAHSKSELKLWINMNESLKSKNNVRRKRRFVEEPDDNSLKKQKLYSNEDRFAFKDNKKFKVHKIIDKRKNGNYNEYLVSWEGYSDSDNTWELEEDMNTDGYSSYIKEYEINRNKEYLKNENGSVDLTSNVIIQNIEDKRDKFSSSKCSDGTNSTISCNDEEMNSNSLNERLIESKKKSLNSIDETEKISYSNEVVNIPKIKKNDIVDTGSIIIVNISNNNWYVGVVTGKFSSNNELQQISILWIDTDINSDKSGVKYGGTTINDLKKSKIELSRNDTNYSNNDWIYLKDLINYKGRSDILDSKNWNKINIDIPLFLNKSKLNKLYTIIDDDVRLEANLTSAINKDQENSEIYKEKQKILNNRKKVFEILKIVLY
jgi:hypothetical protein